MRAADRLTGVGLLAFAGYTIVAGWRMAYWQGRIPGPGFAPIWIGAGLALCALFLVLRRASPAPEPLRSGGGPPVTGGPPPPETPSVARGDLPVRGAGSPAREGESSAAAGGPAEDARPAGRREVLRLLEIAAVTVVGVALMPRLGMMAGVALLLVALVRLFGGTWRSALGTAVVLPALFYLMFVRWLQVPMPKGPWGF